MRPLQTIWVVCPVKIVSLLKAYGSSYYGYLKHLDRSGSKKSKLIPQIFHIVKYIVILLLGVGTF